MKCSLKMFFIVLLASATLISCQPQGNKGQTSSSSKDGAVIATVNGNPVTAKEVKDEISQLPDNYKKMASDKEGLTTLIDDILKKEMLYQEAVKKNLDKSEEYQTRLKDLKRRLMVEMLLTREVEKKTTVSDADAKKFYDDNREKFVDPSAPGEKGKQPVPFAQVKDLIKNRLLQQKQRKAFQDYMDALSKTYTVKLKKDVIKKEFGVQLDKTSGALENSTGDIEEETTGTNAAGQEAPKIKVVQPQQKK